MRNRTTTCMAALAAAAMLASACGSGASLGSAPSDGPVAVETSVEGAVDDVAGADTADGSDDTADEPAAAPGDVSATADNLAPISAEDSSDEILALFDSIHGPTDDISAAVNTLSPFPQLPTPAGSHIISASTFLNTNRPEEAFVSITTETEVKVDGERADIVEQYEAAMAPLGWVLEDKEDRDFAPTGDPGTFLSFEKQDAGLGWERAGVGVVSGEDFTFARLSYSASEFPDADNAIRDRLAGWHGQIPQHDGAVPWNINIGSDFGPGRTDVFFSSQYSVEELVNADKDETLQKLVDKAAAEGIEVEEISGGVIIERENFENFVVQAGSQHIVRGRAKIITPPFEGVAVVAEEKSNDPLPETDATADEIQAVVSEIFGPTEDVAAQMQRIGVFPDLPTPNGADITNFRAGVQNILTFSAASDNFKAANTEVEMFIDGEYDDVNAFYDAQAAALGWTQGDNKTEKTDDGLTTTRRVDYTGPEVDGNPTQAELVITDDVDEARTTVNISYSEIVPNSDPKIKRWQSWFGKSPFPDGGELETAGITTFAFFGDGKTFFYQAEFSYEDSTVEGMLDEIESAVAASDFIVADGETFGEREATKLISADFGSAEIQPLNRVDEVRIELTATRSLLE